MTADWDSAEPFREFIREQTLRFERAIREIAREMRAEREVILQEIGVHREESRRYFERLDAELKDLLDESRAQRGALLRMLDRLDNGGGAAPAT